ncbi:transmembrane channel-like protein 3 isoform X2 [Anthonomus grandis grandis]|nr:transmembrane channel-like protein 3 isoform X2 [Anthonomus grandis grandis]
MDNDSTTDTSSTASSTYLNQYLRQPDDLSHGNVESLESPYPVGYSSIHRLGNLNLKDGGSKLKRAFEARTGGTVRRNLGNNQQKEKLEEHANIIVSKMEQDEALMEDSPDAEELRRTALRDMPQCLTIKRCVRVKLSKSVSQRSKKRTITCWKMLKYQISMGFTKFKINTRDLAYSFELWYGALKRIEGHFGTGVASYFKFLRWLFLVNLSIAVLSSCFIVIPKIDQNIGSPGWGIVSDLISGQGYLTNTVMYYGFYTNETLSSGSLHYSMPHAYFFTMLAIYFVCFLVIGVSAAKSYRRSFIETEGGLKNIFANKIFCGWDYNIATKDAAELKSKAIFNELRELIWDYTKTKYKQPFQQKFRTAIIQFFTNILVVCLIMATGYAQWYFLNNIPSNRENRLVVVPIFVNIVMTFLPMFLSFVVRYEDYKSPKVSLYLTLARTFLLGAVTVGVLVTYWLKNDKSLCWETSLAQEFYRMIIFDFFISVACAALLDVLLYFIYKLLKTTSSLEFDIAWNTMQIIYNQTLFWMGLMFSPILPIVMVIKLFLTWYIRLFIALFLCRPSAKTWRAAQTSTWFLVMTFLSFTVITGVLGYIISSIQTSKECGPFRNYDHIYEIVTLGMLQLKKNSTIWTVVLYITKPGVIALILLFLSAKVYYSRAQANAQKEIVAQCRNMLVWSAKDKEYYYSMISKVTKGQWQYKFHEKTFSPELYATDVYFNGNKGSGDESISIQQFSSPTSGTSLLPSSSTSSDMDYQEYYKKIS